MCLWVHAHIYFHHVHEGNCRNQMMSFYTLALEEKVVVFSHVGAGTRNQVLCKNRTFLNCWAISPALGFYIKKKNLNYFMYLLLFYQNVWLCALHKLGTHGNKNEHLNAWNWSYPLFVRSCHVGHVNQCLWKRPAMLLTAELPL